MSVKKADLVKVRLDAEVKNHKKA
jgi:peptidoglycan hydrolase CwlO-like protein